MTNESSNSLSQNNGSSGNWAVTAPQINLPKGGGAIRGIDEKFTDSEELPPRAQSRSLRLEL
jgi:hypothetical protein